MNLNLTYGNFTVPKFFLHNIFINKMRTKKKQITLFVQIVCETNNRGTNVCELVLEKIVICGTNVCE